MRARKCRKSQCFSEWNRYTAQWVGWRWNQRVEWMRRFHAVPAHSAPLSGTFNGNALLFLKYNSFASHFADCYLLCMPSHPQSYALVLIATLAVVQSGLPVAGLHLSLCALRSKAFENIRLVDHPSCARASWNNPTSGLGESVWS